MWLSAASQRSAGTHLGGGGQFLSLGESQGGEPRSARGCVNSPTPVLLQSPWSKFKAPTVPQMLSQHRTSTNPSQGQEHPHRAAQCTRVDFSKVFCGEAVSAGPFRHIRDARCRHKTNVNPTLHGNLHRHVSCRARLPESKEPPGQSTSHRQREGRIHIRTLH